MIGVIAPSPIAAAKPGAAPAFVAPPARTGSKGRPLAQTQLGTAAPQFSNDGADEPIAPLPPPIDDEPDEPIVRREVKRIGAGPIVGIAVVALAAVGAAAFMFLRGSGAPALSAAIANESAGPSLLVTCESCADGTTIDLGEAKKATFSAHAASVKLGADDLHAGKNVFNGTLSQSGKSAPVALTVNVPFLVRPTLAVDGSEGLPAWTVSFDLGEEVTAVTLAGKALKIDGGKAKDVIAVEPATASYDRDGKDKDDKTWERSVDYEVAVGKGATSKGTLKLALPYAPLRLGWPGRRAIAIGDSVDVSGRTAPGATVRVGVGGTIETAKTDADGTFTHKLKLPAGEGPFAISVTALSPKLGARRGNVSVSHAESAADAKKLLAAETSKEPFATIAADPDAHAKAMVRFEMVVVQVGDEDGRAVAVGDQRCVASAESACPIVRVLLPPGLPKGPAKGDALEIVGVVVGGVSGKTKVKVTQIDASLASPLAR
jgi:hypothetical protein